MKVTKCDKCKKEIALPAISKLIVNHWVEVTYDKQEYPDKEDGQTLLKDSFDLCEDCAKQIAESNGLDITGLMIM